MSAVWQSLTKKRFDFGGRNIRLISRPWVQSRTASIASEGSRLCCLDDPTRLEHPIPISGDRYAIASLPLSGTSTTLKTRHGA
jgi:hypothetical protein